MQKKKILPSVATNQNPWFDFWMYTAKWLLEADYLLWTARPFFFLQRKKISFSYNIFYTSTFYDKCGPALSALLIYTTLLLNVSFRLWHIMPLWMKTLRKTNYFILDSIKCTFKSRLIIPKSAKNYSNCA